MSIEKADIVYMTKDYSIFKRLLGNREVKARGKLIEQKIRKVGYILNPIVVNENYEVVDGQGRLEALKSLKMPVYFVISEGAGIKECQEMNLGTTNWKMNDFVASYADMGNENYIRLKETIDKYKMFSWKTIFNVCKGKYGDQGGLSYNSVNDGGFRYTEANKVRVERILDELSKFVDIAKKIGGRREHLLFAIAFCIEHKLVDTNELRKKMEARIHDISPAATTRHSLEEIERVYNYRRRDKVFLVHEYDIAKVESDYIKKKTRRMKGENND